MRERARHNCTLCGSADPLRRSSRWKDVDLRGPRVSFTAPTSSCAGPTITSQKAFGAISQASRSLKDAVSWWTLASKSALKEYAKLEAAKSRVKRVSTTDPDARVMKQAEGGSAPSYNVQVSTDAAHGLIVDIDATQAGNDYRQLTPAIERIEQSMQRAPEQMVVDGGYISSNNIAEMAKRGIDFVGPESENKAAEANRRKSYKHHGVSAEYEASKFIFDTKTNTYVCPQGKHLRYDAKQESHGAMRYRYKASKQDCDTCPAKDQCCPRTKHGRSIERCELLPDIAAFRKKMQTDEAKAIYKTRSQVAEFPNLWIKTKFGLRQFSVRGVAKVRTESLWVALTYDLLQWIRLRWRPKMVSALAPTT